MTFFKYLILVWILVSNVGCTFLTITVHQTSILDDGDSTKDDYASKETKKTSDSLNFTEDLK